MGSERPASLAFAAAVGIRAALVGILSFAVFWLATFTNRYATIVLLVAAILVLIHSLVRTVRRHDQRVRRLASALEARIFESAGPPDLGSWLNEFDPGLERLVERLVQTRTAAAHQRDYYQGLLDSVGAALLVIHPGGGVELVNRAAHLLARHEVSKLTDLPYVDAVLARRLEQMPTGDQSIVELTDGRRLLALCVAFQDASGPRKLISLQGVGSELDAAEARASTNLVRTLSHEIMNSLTPITSLSASLKRVVSRLPEGQGHTAALAEIADTIASRSDGLLEFVTRYRRVADLPAPTLRRLEVATLIKRVDRVFSAIVHERAIQYASSVDDPGLSVSCDPNLMEHAVINLVHNAIDAVQGQAAPMITVEARANGDWVSLAVTDNGPGLTPDAAANLFVPFFTTKPHGSGIGLSLVRQIATAHGGRLDVSRGEPKGARFVLSWPLRVAAVDAPAPIETR